MKFLSIKQAKTTFDAEDKKIAFCFKKDDLRLNQYKQYQGSPCLIKINSTNMKYEEALQFTDDEPFLISFRCSNLPEGKYVVVCVEDKLVEAGEFTYYPFKVRSLANQSLKVVEAAQKELEALDKNKTSLEGEPFAF